MLRISPLTNKTNKQSITTPKRNKNISFRGGVFLPEKLPSEPEGIGKYIEEVKSLFLDQIKKLILEEPDLAKKEESKGILQNEAGKLINHLRNLANTYLKKDVCEKFNGNFFEGMEGIGKFMFVIIADINQALIAMANKVINKDFFVGDLKNFKPSNFDDIAEKPFDNEIFKKFMLHLLEQSDTDTYLNGQGQEVADKVNSYEGFLKDLESVKNAFLDPSKRK